MNKQRSAWELYRKYIDSDIFIEKLLDYFNTDSLEIASQFLHDKPEQEAIKILTKIEKELFK